MAKCLPKYLPTKVLISLSILLLVSGLGLLGFGPRESFQLTPASSPTPPVFIPPAATSSAVLVTRVIDGDTIEIAGGQRVRYLGVDTPETKDPRKPVQCFGKEASSENKNLVEGKRVILEKDISETDKYGRLLRYIYLPLQDGRLLFVNDYLIRQGFAKTLTIPPDVKFAEQFLEAQRQARENKKGLWEKC